MRTCPSIFMMLLATTMTSGCEHGATGAEVPSPVPTAVNCGDAPQLNQRAQDERRRALAASSDQERISAGNRASFFASMATVADLKCRLTSASIDEVLKPALAAAQRAEAATSFYRRTVQWQEASFLTAQAIFALTQQLPAPPAK